MWFLARFQGNVSFKKTRWGNFYRRIRLTDLDLITESDCASDVIFVYQDGIIIVYHLVIDEKTKTPIAKESISINLELHVSFSYCCFHVPFPEWFRKAHGCKVIQRSILTFPPICVKGEEMNLFCRK